MLLVTEDVYLLLNVYLSKQLQSTLQSAGLVLSRFFLQGVQEAVATRDSNEEGGLIEIQTYLFWALFC